MRPAVEAALAVARQGLTADPPVPPPPGLRRYLGFAKLSVPALRAIARVVDTDDSFRERVAAEADEATVGRAGILWLTRPDGWTDELARLEAEQAAAAADHADVVDERDARRRLAAAQAAAERSAAAARVRAEKLDAMRAELASERARRTAAEKRVEELEAALATQEEADAAAARRLEDAEAGLAAMRAERDQAREAADAAAPPAPTRPPPSQLEHIREALHRSLHRAEELTQALRDLESAALIDEPPHRPDRSTSPPQSRPARRRPLALPPGLRDDSADAVDHLLRMPGMLLLVDGYNVSMVGWPDVPVREQRKRLLAALDEKALRTGAPIEVVFDGAEVDTIGVRRQGRQLLRVRFSPPGVEADDVLLDLVEQLPPRRPVTVASSDKRVRTGARAQGANLLHARQLVAALRSL